MSKIPFRAPAVPLIVHDPYFSVWSFSDELNQSWPRHWTGASMGLEGLLRVDGETGIFCGNIWRIPKAEQRSVEVHPTRTVYRFEFRDVELTVTFLTPALMEDLDLLSRPVSYVVFDARSISGKAHTVDCMMALNGQFCTDKYNARITWGKLECGALKLGFLGNERQDILSCSGDDLRIDWGRALLGLPEELGGRIRIADICLLQNEFEANGTLDGADDFAMPKQVWGSAGAISAGAAFSLRVEGAQRASGHLLMAYDDILSIEFLGRRLPAYWRRDGMAFDAMLLAAEREFESIRRNCEAFDASLEAHLEAAGGREYALIGALAYRQAIGAHKLVAGEDGRALFFSKENFSNGCIATVDVTYPSAPLFLLLQPELLKGMLIPILEYAQSPRWKFPFAPHDLGTYPLANGQVYGGGERTGENQMPVEECGNMLLLAGALLQFTDNLEFLKRYRGLWRCWAEYLADKGYDPENQLCTDDFAGHLAHNTNLSLKAILALGAYGKLAMAFGETEEAARYGMLSKAFAEQWVRDAADGESYRLAFDQPGSWSQKYNLVWDRLLGLNLFPKEVARREVAFYRTKLEKYGLPLDSRKSYTKLDWIFWSATLTGDEDDFRALMEPVFRWVNETPSRVPLTDWYETTDGKMVGFQARSVLGGIYLRLLEQ